MRGQLPGHWPPWLLVVVLLGSLKLGWSVGKAPLRRCGPAWAHRRSSRAASRARSRAAQVRGPRPPPPAAAPVRRRQHWLPSAHHLERAPLPPPPAPPTGSVLPAGARTPAPYSGIGGSGRSELRGVGCKCALPFQGQPTTLIYWIPMALLLPPAAAAAAKVSLTPWREQGGGNRGSHIGSSRHDV